MGLKFSIFQRYTTRNTRSMTLDQDKCCNDTENCDTKNHMQNIHHEERPNEIKILLSNRIPNRKTQIANGWNPNDCSSNMSIKDEGRWVYRSPTLNSTDAARGAMGYSKGIHIWDVTWKPSQRGTNPLVGVATKKALLQCAGYKDLVGANVDSWGWSLEKMKLIHNKKYISEYPYKNCSTSQHKFSIDGNIIRCILNMDQGNLSFEVEGIYLGIAFENLKGLTLYPCISSVWGQCEVGIFYKGSLDVNSITLMDWCRLSLINDMGTEKITTQQIKHWNITKQAERFLTNHHENVINKID